MKILCLACLTFVTGPDEPSDVFVEVRPPETNEEVVGCREDTFVSKMIMSVLNEMKAFRGLRDQLELSIANLPKHLAINHEVVRGLSNELSIFVIAKRRGTS